MNQLSIRKILQILYYIQSRVSNQKHKSDQMYLLKMLYFADRHHLRHYGITISNDTYYAMKKGPVAISTFNILKKNMPHSANSAEASLLDDIKDIYEYNVSIKQQMEDELSESNKISLDFVINEFGKFNQCELSDISHDYPEWLQYKQRINDGIANDGKVSFKIPLEDFFEDPIDIPNLNKLNINKDPFAEPDKEFLKLMKESVHEITC